MSLVVVHAARHLPALTPYPLQTWLITGRHRPILLAGSLIGAWLGASWAIRLRSGTLHKVIAVFLVAIAILLLLGHDTGTTGGPSLAGFSLIAAGVIAGFLIGVVAALLGVAGGELLIPTLVLLFGVDIKLAGSLSLAVSLPTMLTSFARYSRDRSFGVLRCNWGFALAMALGPGRALFVPRPSSQKA